MSDPNRRWASIPALAVLLALFASACTADAGHSAVEFSVDGTRILASGEIDADALADFEDILDATPGIDTLVLRNIGGSVDDVANVEFGRTVRASGLVTLVPADGLVASGGTDLFLAGARRILEPGACVGVHAWAADSFTANDLPRSDPEHDLYLDYYADLGVDAQFYWFTLRAAPAEGMHWMTADEANRFDLATGGAPRLGSTPTCDAR